MKTKFSIIGLTVLLLSAFSLKAQLPPPGIPAGATNLPPALVQIEVYENGSAAEIVSFVAPSDGTFYFAVEDAQGNLLFDAQGNPIESGPIPVLSGEEKQVDVSGDPNPDGTFTFDTALAFFVPAVTPPPAKPGHRIEHPRIGSRRAVLRTRGDR